ncbi:MULTISPECIES: phosphate/phosphite/phosphonate ABC transporter substrate-binding protein [unclassified Agarivorans]|uniref:phosphate/phosphite/phosphonate ABC transporter substrate-binding protein n=1 Tax=unclassified Agarivorans TaxID=2636026 RepID=UPI0026E407C9|nr:MULTISPECIES: phosphate/phosphite/phosphonate ABC transporter substrate-binding protein [unclassified Agarivorans]MDO6687001.1 phosphate/phosphite/phosphonate ABC transporter substrate-binding protein [Agarivorans sp. 3_MG-2023]MDO6713587.1 phosphate/phosphite/phosphonate ABC transporter substrate-binding protein [Agarivorans sp. 2_MG-2023]
MFFILQTNNGASATLSKQKPDIAFLEIKSKQYKAKRKMQIKVTVLLVAILLVILAIISSSAEAKSYTFGIVPQQSATRLALQWSPVLDAVSDTSGYQVEFKTAPSIPEFEKRLANGEYDFAYMNPFHYQVFSASPGYKAFAKTKDKKLNGIIVVRTDSDINITDVQQLNGKTLAFPAPRAFAASVVTRGYLEQQGVAFVPKYVGSHDSVYRAVAAGLYPAGGGIPRTFANGDADVTDQLTVLWESPDYTPHAIAAHPEVPAEVVKKIQQALVEMENKPEQQALLDGLKMKGFEVAKDKDWDDVRQLSIGDTHH